MTMRLALFRRGTSVRFAVETRDGTKTPPPLFTPTGGVKLSLTDPTGAVVLTEVAMTEASVGKWTYVWASPTNAPTGIYTVTHKAVNGSHTTLTPPQAVLQLVP